MGLRGCDRMHMQSSFDDIAEDMLKTIAEGIAEDIAEDIQDYQYHSK